jgi:hypothetical protein
MELMEIEIVELELKYCERCGTLWLRPTGSSQVYCGSCAPKMAENVLPEECPRRVRLPIGDGESFEAALEELAAICGVEGNA